MRIAPLVDGESSTTFTLIVALLVIGVYLRNCWLRDRKTDLTSIVVVFVGTGGVLVGFKMLFIATVPRLMGFSTSGFTDEVRMYFALGGISACWLGATEVMRELGNSRRESGFRKPTASSIDEDES